MNNKNGIAIKEAMLFQKKNGDVNAMSNNEPNILLFIDNIISPHGHENFWQLPLKLLKGKLYKI